MTLRPSSLPLCLLLLLSGAVCQTETGFETESPVRTLQVETLVRRLSRAAEGREGLVREYWSERTCEPGEVRGLSWGVLGLGARTESLADPP